MLPDFLGDFRPQLEAYKLDYLTIHARPLRRGETTLLTQSKFLGTPFLPVGIAYPHDVLGKPMLPLAQINFAEAPTLAGYPTSGILQLFLSPTQWYNNDPKDYRILYHANPQVAAQKDFSFLIPDLYEESPVHVEHALTFSRATEYGGTQDCRFDMDFGGKDYYEYQETLSKDQQDQLDAYCYNVGHKIGGYAYFTQEDPRGYSDKQRDDVLLLQIDTDKQVMWGDAGVANLFISPAALAARQFDRAWFTWDCT